MKNSKFIKFWKYIAIAVFALFWFQVASEFEIISGNHHNTTYSEVGINQIVPSFGEPLSEKFGINEIGTHKVINQKGNILEIETRILGKNILTDEIIFDLKKVYHVDKNTHMHTDESLGLFDFPENVEKKDYFMTYPAVTQSATFVFIQEKIINGLKIYQFDCKHTGNDITMAFPQFYPHNLVIDAQCTMFVEPITGNILNFELSWENYFVENGEKVQLAEIGSKKTTEYSTLILSQYVKNQLDYKNILLFVPSSIFILVTMIVVSLDLFKKSKIELLEQKELSEKFHKQIISQENLKKALDSSSDVAITNKNGIITQVNNRFCETSKYSRDELIGKSHNILKSGHHSPEYYKNMWDVISSGKVWHDQILNKAKDGTMYWNDMVIVPFLDKDKKIQEYVSIRRDITERIKLHEEKLKNEKMVTVGKLSARLAHDLRNPLSIIKISLENMRMLYGEGEIQVKQMDKIDRSIDRITHQVEDVLQFVRKRPIIPIKTKISEIISESFDSLVIPDTIKLNLPQNDCDITCDKEQLATALNNLILNGIQAVNNSGTITIRVKEITDSIIIEVEDSGKGIPKEDLDEIFEPLFTTKMQGTGLGLVSVKSIIDAHKGTISVTSPPTIFTITLPKTLDQSKTQTNFPL